LTKEHKQNIKRIRTKQRRYPMPGLAQDTLSFLTVSLFIATFAAYLGAF
jgi:hypothetical protein